MVELAKTITLPGKTFRAWKKGEYGFSTLVTLILPPGSETIKREIVVPLVLKQNGLSGQHTQPRFKIRTSTKDEAKSATLVTMGVSPDLASGLRALGGYASMGARTVRVNLKREVPEEVVEENVEDKNPPNETPAKAATETEGENQNTGI